MRSRAWVLFALFLASPLMAGDTATLILSGGRVWTADPAWPWAEVVAVRGDRLLAVGSAAEVARRRACPPIDD